MKFLRDQYLLIVVIILGITLLLFLVFYYMANGSLPYANPGIFGDFMGGVVGTLLTAVASVFVYNTYQTQVKQLELQKKEANQNLIDNLYDRISKEIDDIEIVFENDNEEESKTEFVRITGINVLYNFGSLYLKTNNTVLNQIALTLISFEHLFALTNKSVYKWEMQKEINKDRNYLLFYTKIIWPLYDFYRKEWKKLIEQDSPHPDSLLTRARFENLLKESYQYLLQRKLVGLPSSQEYMKLLEEIA